MLRTLLGMSQDKLGDLLGVTCQQVLKYERGINRIGSSRLYELGQALNVPVSFFFDDMIGRQLPDIVQDPLPDVAEGSEAFHPGMDDIQKIERCETLKLIRAYYQITDVCVRKCLFELVMSLGKLESVSDIADDETAEKGIRKGKEFPDNVTSKLANGVSPVKVFRKYRRMTQKEVAARAGCTTTYISQMERRNRTGSMEMLLRLAHIFDVDVRELVDS